MKVQYVDNLYICAVTNGPNSLRKLFPHSGIIRHDPTMAQATWSLAVFLKKIIVLLFLMYYFVSGIFHLDL